MRRFQFPLEKVLRLRKQETERARRQLAFALAAEREAAQMARRARTAVEGRIEMVLRQEDRTLTAAAFASQRAYLDRLRREAAEAEERLAAAREETGRARDVLLAARRWEQMLEKLRERRLESWRAEALREEQKGLDDLGGRSGLNALTPRPEI